MNAKNCNAGLTLYSKTVAFSYNSWDYHLQVKLNEISVCLVENDIQYDTKSYSKIDPITFIKVFSKPVGTGFQTH